MRALLLLVAMVAAGQTLPTHIPRSGQPITLEICQSQTPDTVMFCATKGPIHYNYRIDWLRPDLYLWPSDGSYDLGSPSDHWKHIRTVYVMPPLDAVVILLPNGKRVTTSRAELDGRAK